MFLESLSPNPQPAVADTVGSLPYNIKHFEVTAVVMLYYIIKIELNLIICPVNVLHPYVNSQQNCYSSLLNR